MNRTYIQNKSVSRAGKSIHLKLLGLTAGRKSFVVHPTDQTSVAQGLFLGRAVAQTHPAALKMTWALLVVP